MHSNFNSVIFSTHMYMTYHISCKLLLINYPEFDLSYVRVCVGNSLLQSPDILDTWRTDY